MRKLKLFTFLLASFTGLLNGCKKDEIKTVLTQNVAPVFSASKTSVVLTPATAADSVLEFTWTRSQHGFKAAVRYTLQIARAGTNFAAPREVNMGNRTNQKYTVGDLNQLAIILGLAPNNAGQLEARVKSSITDSVANLNSNVIAIALTPYLVVVNYPSLWAPGEYQGWNPASAPKVSSRASNGIYEGYVNIVNSNRSFKFTSHPNWDNVNYGWVSSTVTGANVTGTFAPGASGNLFVPNSGFYLLTANTNNNTWSGTSTSWSLIGSAPTASNNWAVDVPMTYNSATNLWTVTTNLAAGVFKFRANNAWALNFGDTGADLILDYNGTDIVVPAALAGSRTITLDLKAGNYTYTIQ
ncbi:MAG: DUF5116 domain-containing protein [Bacteroidetes bacterium]|nr:MAG: DUF5116 domain-containing protein [Bacteroidota bacterium]